MPLRYPSIYSVSYCSRFYRNLALLKVPLFILACSSPAFVYGQNTADEKPQATVDEQIDAAVDSLADEPPAAGRTQELLVRGQQETQPAIKLKDVPLSVSVVTGVGL